MNAKSPKIVAVSRNFDYDYFDGDRKFGYGGYVYDGRWLTIAKKLIQEYSLSSGMKVLDIGCAKGFLVKDLMITCPGLEVRASLHDLSPNLQRSTEIKILPNLKKNQH
jgi:cyclopropane fatty-acyl-phospholipid synthase-like methyltransferase